MHATDHRPRIMITGISRGIGRALALAAADAGYDVAGIHRGTDPSVSQELTAQIEQRGVSALVMTGDAGLSSDIDAAAERVVSEWGGIDVWVNNAARLLVQPFLDMSDEDWASLLNSNLMGYIRGARAAARTMVKAGYGRIINISSVVADQPPTEMTGYVTAKGGITGLTRALAVELGPRGVTVNAVAPGATETPLNTEAWTDEVRDTYRGRIPLGRIATPEDVADAILLVASEQSRYMTGQVIAVDGGLLLNGSVGHRKN
ncbi:SDR family NAD(P)-dependent oxidoreductase [Microbacterium testaceum]|uniref:SDR family NAD(P)-dependent oxidoreductase n=1 Tax=Microbacterium testaceum TaxID=2033 RepID=UPI001245EC2E|nr:SDR family NAD(P)-dependent oxidoreductase [Microbacterium testaceum]